MDIAAIEASLVERLAPLRDFDIWVRGLPNQAKDMGVATNRGIITIYLDKTKFEDPQSTGTIVQDVMLHFCVDIRLGFLRDNNGSYAALRYICNRLIGFQPPRSRKVYLLDHEFMGEKEKFWVHQLKLVVPTQVFEVDEDSDLVLLKQITLEDGYGGVIVNEGSLFN